MALSEAEERRQRFIKQKQSAGGDVYLLQKQLQNVKYTVWWDIDGNIRCISSEPESVNISALAECKSEVFDKEQVDIVLKSNWGMYHVRTDPNVDTVHYIELKPVEATFVSQEDAFLSEIEKGKRGDITVSVTGKEFTIKCNKKVQDTYKDTDLSSATAKGSRLLKFYFTSINDPSFMVYNINVPLPELLENKTVKKTLPYDLSQSSVYTVKLFDKYVRT
jgi:hypothetical protein